MWEGGNVMSIYDDMNYSLRDIQNDDELLNGLRNFPDFKKASKNDKKDRDKARQVEESTTSVASKLKKK